MRRILITSWLVCLTAFAHSQWTWRNPVPQGNDLNVIRIKNDNSIWAAGYVGTVMHSEDGGLGWEMINLVGHARYTNFIGLDWPGDSTGFAVDRSGYIYRTLDAGITWDSMYWETEEYLNASCFTDTQDGFVVCSGGKIIRTLDGGNTWTPYYFQEPVNLNCVCFTSSLTGYAAGSPGYILKTTNGGNDWNAVHVDSATVLRCMVFPSANIGFVAGANGLVMKTTDGGLTWASQYLNDSASFSSIAMFSPDTLILNGTELGTISVYSGPVRYRSTNGGNSWTRLQLPASSPYSANLTAKTGGVAFAAGSWGSIEKTTDYGNSWISHTTWVSPPLAWGAGIYGMDFPTAQIGYAAIDEGEAGEGKILKSADGGATWFIQDTASKFHGFRAVDFINENTGCIGGVDIFSTFDGGQTWIPRVLNLGWHGVKSLSHTENGVFVAVGYDGIFLRSTDYGQSWINVPGVPNLGYRSVCFSDANNGFAAGNSTLLKTTDAGATWNVINEGSYIFAIDFPTPDKGFAVGSNGLILQTTDGGDTWEQHNFPTTDDLYAVRFYDADTGYAVGGTEMITGLVLKTTDGGATWHKQFIPSNYPLYAVATTGNCAYTGGLWCYLFGTTNGGIQVSTGPPTNSQVADAIIFPNPSSSKITILDNRKFPGEKKITILTVTGKTVISEMVKNQHRLEMDVSALPPGTYLVKIQSSETVEVKKLVIQ
ncbi:MAG: YCF48-related protein [Bacteroidetes bacterium]|nr:YCF48-related protein [Bacteroidota bacterium]